MPLGYSIFRNNEDEQREAMVSQQTYANEGILASPHHAVEIHRLHYLVVNSNGVCSGDYRLFNQFVYRLQWYTWLANYRCIWVIEWHRRNPRRSRNVGGYS